MVFCPSVVPHVLRLIRVRAQNLAETAARFKQPFRRELESVTSRRVLYEGFLTKVCSNGRGKHKKYRV